MGRRFVVWTIPAALIASVAAHGQAPIEDSRLRPAPERATSGVLVYEFGNWDAGPSLEGVVIRPAGEGRWPAVVVNHGATNQPMDKALQIGPQLARRGCVTVAPRYSFSGPRPGDPPGTRRARDTEADVRRCVGAARFARSLPFVDGARVGVAGISAGGFLIVRALQGKHPFVAAVVVSAGLSKTPDPGSPLDAVRVPVLTIVGTADTVIAPAYGERLDAALRRAGGVSRLIRYADAPHDLFEWDGVRIANDIADWMEAESPAPHQGARR